MESKITQVQIPDLGTALIRTGGVLLVWIVLDSLFGINSKDTVNYILIYRGRIVYHGITYADRIQSRLAEHRVDGKMFDSYRVSGTTSREVAQRIEQRRIRRDNPHYNIQHNCY